MARKQFGNCRICGESGPLTFEHVPPKSAGNEPYGVALDVTHHLTQAPDSDPRSMRRKKLPRGSGGYYFCSSCNNSTGSWYVPDYADWVHQGERHRRALGDENSIALPFHIFPGRVFKQILTIFAATCGSGLFDAHPRLRKLVLNRAERGGPGDLRVYCYIVHQASHYSRHSGVAGLLNLSGRSHTFAEFAYRPFGYILTLDGKMPPDNGLFDVTFFGSHGFNDYRDLHLPIPVRPVESYFPADFRTKTEWEDVIDKAQANRPA